MAAEKKLSFSINIDGVSNESLELEKLSFQISNLKKEKAELLKVAKAEGILSTENKQKLAAYTKEINNQEAGLKTLKRVVDTANDSLERKKALLIQLTAQSNKASEAVAAKMAPAIKKLNDEIKAGEQARGVFTRNVGNYPGLAGAATDGMNQLSGAVGGVTAEIGTAATSFLSAGGVVGVFTATIGALAAAWKRTQENIELYLKSADKLKYGFAGFGKDAETVRKDAIRRSSGQITTGRMQLTEANRVMEFGGSTEEQKEQARLMAEQAKAMISEGQAFRDQVMGIQDKITWTLKYNKLLQDEEVLADEKLAKEIEWEELEANLIKQRAIVSNLESTSLQKKQAAIDADIIADKLVKGKTDYIERQIKNIEDISAMTFTQEVVEDKINGLLKEKNTIQKEYYADQIKINKLEAKGVKDGKKWGKTWTAETLDVTSFYQKYSAPDVVAIEDPEVKKEILIQKEKDRIWENGLKKARENFAINKQDAQDQANELINIELARLDKKKEIQDAEIAITAGIGETLKLLAGKNKALSLTAMAVEKASAIAQIISNVSIANAKAMAISPITFGQPWVGINTGIGAIHIAKIIAESVKSAGEISKYATGGKIQGGFQVHSDTSRDNTLIYAKQGETVLNERQIAALGGSATMRRIKVPGYANGGYIGQQAPEIPATGFDYAAMARIMNSIEVNLNVHKLNSAQREVQIITETQRI